MTSAFAYDGTSFMSGGVTLSGQSLAVGSVWRLRFFGNFVITSGGLRHGYVQPYWGGAAAGNPLDFVFGGSTPGTDPIAGEFMIVGAGSASAYVSGYITISNNEWVTVNALVTGMSTGAQTLDLQFAVSATVATEGFNVWSITMERLK
jgi:hypothetical protein